MKVLFLILTYNQEAYIQAAIEGALSQTYEEMEILVSDDCSTDDTYGVIMKTVSLYKGERVIHVNRNTRNLGLVSHLNYLLSTNYSDYIFLSGGDDISMPNRVEIQMKEFMNDSTVMAVSGSAIVIDRFGKHIQNYSQYYQVNTLEDGYLTYPGFMVGGAGLAVKRCVYSDFGKLNDDCPTEDSTLRFRSLLLGKVVCVSEDLIYYRRHANSLSSDDNIFKLSTKGMIRQYKSDSKNALQRSIISRKMYRKIYRKIIVTKIVRMCAEKKKRYPKYIRAFFRLIQITSKNCLIINKY